MSNALQLTKGNFVLREVLIVERKKAESDIWLNNPDLLSCSSHFYID